MTVATDTTHCPCGCGTVVDPPPPVGNVWHPGQPYWAFMCLRNGCEAQFREQRNQTGDRACPWCGAKRFFVGHFQARSNSWTRLTVLGEKEPIRTLASFYFKKSIVFNEQGDTT